MLITITTLPGDGIGPEVTAQAVRVLEACAEIFGHQLKITEKNVGGAALVASNDPFPKDTEEACLSSGAVLLGAVGGPAFSPIAISVQFASVSFSTTRTSLLSPMRNKLSVVAMMLNA